LGLTTARGRIRDDNSFAADIPPESASLSIDHELTERLVWGARLFLAARDQAPGPTETATPGYGTVDFLFGYRVSSRLDLRFILRNLLDKQYPATSDALAVNAPGRGATLFFSGSL
jgi:outer membrane receptor protein involved in Fe transport